MAKSEWLDILPSHQGWVLLDTGQLGRIVEEFSDPANQYPSFLLFVGNLEKDIALKALFPHNNTQRRGPQGICKLHVASNTTESVNPILFADINLKSNRPSQDRGYVRDRKFKKLDMRYPGYVPLNQARLDITFRLVIPFSHMVYIFADDLGGPSELQAFLWGWVEATGDRPFTCHALPGLTIITSNNSAAGYIESIDEQLRTTLLQTVVCSLVTLDLHDRCNLSATAKYEPLRGMMRRDIQLSRELHTADYELYSARHLDALFSRAAVNVTQHPNLEFSTCQSARQDNPVPQRAVEHLEHFFRHAVRIGAPMEEIARFLASALIMNAYPPHMHRFNPHIMFSIHYKTICLLAWSQAGLSGGEPVCEEVELQFCRMFTKLYACSDTSAHRWYMAKQNRIWTRLTTNNICPSCLLRGSDFVLPCGHTTCSKCARMRASSRGGAEYAFLLTHCILCDERFKYIVNILPPTARPLLLVLDGGGVRGAITLAFLRELEVRLGIPLWQLPHLTVGTSAGGIIAMEIICQRSPALVAQEKFLGLAQHVFPSDTYRTTLLGRACKIFRSWLTDERYNSSVLEATLRNAFGTSHHLFKSSPSGRSDGYIALTASQVDKDGKLGVFSNYRRLRRENIDSSYSLLTPACKFEEPLGWQVARCVIAALGYFTPYHIQGIGTVQDGGICANCPLRVAIRESHFIWPDVGRPDLVLSIGTGISMPILRPREIQKSSGFLIRGIRAFLYSPAVDSNEGFSETFDSLPYNLKSDVLRLNLDIEGQVPDLDDTTCMKDFMEASYTIPDDYIQSLLATSFFFELDENPEEIGNEFYCTGSILYLRGDCRNFLSILAKELPLSNFIITPGTYLGSVDQHDGCENCGYYRKKVSFAVPTLNENIQIAIHSTFATRRVNGFPTTINALSQAQEIDAPFGRSDHGAHWRSDRICYCLTPSSKRSRNPELSIYPSKKRRLV